MITVSDRWKEIQKGQLVPLSEIEIEYNVSDPDAQASAYSTATNEESFSSAANIVNPAMATEPKYALLERNLWVLDGSFRAVPTYVESASGFVSRNISNEDGTFTEIPTITIRFDDTLPSIIPGLTLTWSKTYEEWAEAFRVTAYNGDTEVVRFEVTDNRKVSHTAEFPAQGYNRIVIEILKWCLPYRRARMTECLIGVKRIYTKNDLMGFEHEQSVDLLSAELPKNAIVFKLDNSSQVWNPDNPTGAEKYLIEKQTLTVRYGFRIDGGIEWIKAGTFYMSEWQTPSNGLEATFTARDILEFCGDPYVGPRSGVVVDIVRSALSQSGVHSNSYVIDEVVLGSVRTDFTEDDTEYTCAEILQLCANAAKCCLWQCRDGFLHIEPVEVNLTDYVIGQISGGVNNSYKHPEFNLTKELKTVDVNKGLGTAVNSATGNIQTLENPLIVSNEVANSVAEWCRECLKNRKIVSGEFRADPRLDVLDTVTVVSKYGSNPVQITNVKYTYAGAFRGSYTGRVMD